MPKPLRCRDMLKRLKKVNKDFKIVLRRGKGSHRMVALGQNHYPFPCHDDGTEIAPCYLKDILRRFDLPDDLFD